MTTELDLALECARRAAAIIVDGFSSDVPAEFKGEADPVTEIDRAAEDAVRDLLAAEAPDDRILGEERGGAGWSEGRVWIIDPLDGTVNFIHRLPQVAVSIALWDDGTPLVGVIADATRGECFAATAGGGATLDGRAIGVSKIPDLTSALVATGFAYDRRERGAEYGARLGRVLSAVQGIRRLGSAALDLCWVACGRYDGYWETGLQPWDSAAGALIVTEAGGRVTDLAGDAHRLDAPGLVATNGTIHDALRELTST